MLRHGLVHNVWNSIPVLVASLTISLPSKPVDGRNGTLWCDHSNESYRALLSISFWESLNLDDAGNKRVRLIREISPVRVGSKNFWQGVPRVYPKMWSRRIYLGMVLLWIMVGKTPSDLIGGPDSLPSPDPATGSPGFKRSNGSINCMLSWVFNT